MPDPLPRSSSLQARIEKWAKDNGYGFSLAPDNGRVQATVWTDPVRPWMKAWGDTVDEALESFEDGLLEDGIHV